MIYVGSLGKMLFRGCVWAMVVPEHLVDTFRTGLSELYREGQLMQQAVLAEFIMDGHLTSHVRRMRTLYGERRQLMIDAIRARFGDALPVMGDEAACISCSACPTPATIARSRRARSMRA